jgi:hypothetical protein
MLTRQSGWMIIFWLLWNVLACVFRFVDRDINLEEKSKDPGYLEDQA